MDSAEEEKPEPQEASPAEDGAAKTPPTADLDSSEQKIKIDESSSEKPSRDKLDTDSEETPRVSDGAGVTPRKTDASGSRPQSQISTGRAKSSLSGDIVFEAKKKKKKSETSGDDAHTVTFTVSIAMAVPTGEFFS